MRKIILPLSAVTCAILAGCMAVGPDYERPKIDAPKSYNVTDFNITLADKNSSINPKWWLAYGDENLSNAIETALSANYDVQVAQSQVDVLLGQFDQVKAGLYPTISAGASMQNQSITGSPSFVKQQGNQLGYGSTTTLQLAMATYEIDLWGKVYRATEAARGMLYSSEYNKRTVQLGVISNTANNYITLASLDSQIALAKENLLAAKEIEKLTKKRYEIGTVNQQDYMSSVAQTQSAVITLETLKANRSTAQSAYNVLLGQNPKTIQPSSIDVLKMPNVPSGLPSELLERRPDVAGAEQKLVAQTANIGVAKAAYFPSISLTGMFGNISSNLSNILTTPAMKMWQFSPAINLPIFTGGALAGQLAQAKAGQQEALASYRGAVVSAFNDADNAIKQNYLAKTQAEAAKIKADSLKITLGLSKKSYEVGTISYLSLMQIEQNWLGAEISAVQAKQSALVASVNLYKALGGSWDEKLGELPSLLPSGR